MRVVKGGSVSRMLAGVTIPGCFMLCRILKRTISSHP